MSERSSRITLSEIHRVLLAYKKAETSVRIIRPPDGSVIFEPIGSDPSKITESDLDSELKKFEASHAG